MILAYVTRSDGFGAIVGLILVVWLVGWLVSQILGAPFRWIEKRKAEREAKKRKQEIPGRITTVTVEWIEQANHWLVTLSYKGKDDVIAGCTFRTWKAAKDYVNNDLQRVQASKDREHDQAREEQQAKLRRDPTWQAQEEWEQQKARYHQRQQRKRKKHY